MNNFHLKKPLEGLQGLKQNWKADLLSGFLVSLIALPLSLGIAGASGFPPIMGVMAAIVGGVIVSFFTNSALTIKGPAAGLIVIVAGAVEELGRSDATVGWHLTLGAIVVAGFFQMLMGFFKLPRFADFFSLSAVHGMLAAIGIIIMSKQIHLAVGIAPAELAGKEPLELLLMVPHSLAHMESHIAIIGLVGLVILFGWKYIPVGFLKKVPPALIVLLVASILGRFFHLFDPQYQAYKPLINPGEFTLNFNADFAAMSGANLPIFAKYVLMFTLVGSLESLLTVKAIDLLDPYKRKSDLSKDVIAVGLGNVVSGMLGGLPLISEVARSSANINYGGKTRWANLFHGVFLLIFVLLLAPVIKMVPVAALAAMLIFVGYRLASPSEFKHVYHIGREQLVIFLVTIVFTIATDLLIGIAAGILTKMLIQLFMGVKLSHIFNPKTEITFEDNCQKVRVLRAAVFTNYLHLKGRLESLPPTSVIIVDFSQAPYVDHTVMENIPRFQKEYEQSGGKFTIEGLEAHRALSAHPLAARKQTQELSL